MAARPRVATFRVSLVSSTHPFGPGFLKALRLAITTHSGQLRRGGSEPYLAHVFGVAAMVAECGGSGDQVIAALLHDAVEDGGGPAMLTRIAGEFGQGVAAIVAGLSDNLSARQSGWRARKQVLLDHVEAASDEELLVAIADKIDNAAAICRERDRSGDAIWTTFADGRSDAEWYYGSLVERFAVRLPGGLSESLGLLVNQMFAESAGRRRASI